MHTYIYTYIYAYTYTYISAADTHAYTPQARKTQSGFEWRLVSQAFACCLESHCIKRMGTFDSDAWAVKAERLLCSSVFDTAEQDVSDVRVSPLSFFVFSFPPPSFSLLFFHLLQRLRYRRGRRVRCACVTSLFFSFCLSPLSFFLLFFLFL